MVLEAARETETEASITGKPRGGVRFYPGDPRINRAGRPKKNETYQDLAASRPAAKKLQVILKQEQVAIKQGSTRAAEFLRDTAEGKPATRIIVQSSPAMNELMNEWEVEASPAAGDAVVALQLKEAADGN